MEHLYGRAENAWKNYYLILQISQLLNDLVRFGDYIKKITGDPTATFAAVYGTIETFARRLAEHLRYRLPDLGPPPLKKGFQIRLAKL